MTNENQQGTKTTRRNFLKGAGLALAGATAFGLAGCASGEADSASSNEKWDGEYDVIVAGRHCGAYCCDNGGGRG